MKQNGEVACCNFRTIVPRPGPMLTIHGDVENFCFTRTRILTGRRNAMASITASCAGDFRFDFQAGQSERKSCLSIM